MSIFPSSDARAIAGIRHQIIANASVLFPKVVKGKRQSLFRWGHASADVLFEITVISINDASGAQAIAEAAAPATKYQAILTHGLVTKQQTVAVGDIANSIYGALETLLAVTANELAVRKGKKLAFAEIKPGNVVRSAGGLVDGSLFEKAPVTAKFKRTKV